MSAHQISVGILTVSDRSFRGERPDRGGPALRAVVERRGWQVAAAATVPDEVDQIRAQILDWVDRKHIDLVLTTGGTGISPRDVTPEATLVLLHKELPGLMEWVRLRSAENNPAAVLSRALAGVRKKSLIVNFPGNPEGAQECLEITMEIIPHALAMTQGHDHEDARHADA